MLIQPTNYSSLLSSSNGNAFLMEREAHIDNHKNGQGHVSNQMYGEIQTRNEANGSFLGENDPSASVLYSQYMTMGFSYENQARFVTSVYEQNQSMGVIYDAAEKDSNQKASQTA